MKKSILFWLALLCMDSVKAQELPLGECLCAEVAWPRSLTNTWFFPASAANEKQALLGISHTMPYGLSDLSTMGARAVMPLNNGGLALRVQQGGFKGYQFRKGSVVSAYQFGELHAGLSANFHQIALQQQESPYGFSLDASLHLPLSPTLRIGAMIENAFQQSWMGQSKEGLASQIILGVAHRPMEQLFGYVAIQKNSFAAPSVLASIRYEWNEQFFIGMSYQGRPNKLTWSIGYEKKQWAINLVAQKHYLLGFSQQLLLLWRLGAPTAQPKRGAA